MRSLTAAVAALVLCAAPSASLAARVGAPAPNFRVFTFDHQAYSLAQLRGQVIVLNFWAVWCAPCRAEMQVMDTYARQHPGQGLRIFAVTVDDTASDSQLRPLAKALAFPLATRISGWGYGEIDGAVPTSYVIDRAGILRHAEPGAFTDDSFDALITPLLAEPPPGEAPAPGMVGTSAPIVRAPAAKAATPAS